MTRFRFDRFIVDTDRSELVGPDGARSVEPQVFAVLCHLVAAADRLVTKEELLDAVWGDRFVSESALTTRIKQVRRVLDDDGRTQWAVRTVHGRGYRFLPAVTVIGGDVGGLTSGSDAARTVRSVQVAPMPDVLRADVRNPFCGRDAELARGLRLLSGIEPSYRWVWIVGEPGIGKSRLAAELASEAHARGHRVLFGRNGEDLRVPYQPFIEALRQWSAGHPTADLPRRLALLLGGEPSGEDVTHRSGQGLAPATDSDALRYHLFEAVADWLAELTEGATALIVLDDVHWAADSTLQLLRHLQQRPTGVAVTFVLTARDTAPDAHPKVAELLAVAQGQPHTEVLALGGLTPEAAQRLVGEVDDLDEVMRQTAGNPLFLQAVNADDAVDIGAAVRRRLARLPTGVQDVLRLVAVLGIEFELTAAAIAAGRDELDLLDDLELAVAARLLEDVGLDRFRFAHALVRSSLRAELSSSRHARLHERVATALEQLHPVGADQLAALAHHTAEAARVRTALRPVAIERLRRAARASMASFSYREAAELLTRALSLTEGPADRRHDAPTAGDRGVVAELCIELGDAEARAGRNVPAAQHFADAVELARRCDNVPLEVEAALRYEDAAWRPGFSDSAALAVVDHAMAALDRFVAEGATVPALGAMRARLAVGRLRALAMAGRRDGVDAAYADACRLAAEVGSADLEANALSVYAGQVLFPDDVPAAEPIMDRLAVLAPRLADGEVALHAVYDRLVYCVLRRRHAQRTELLRAMTDMQERSHATFWRFVRLNIEAMEAFYIGDLTGAEELAEGCLHLAGTMPEEDGSGTYGLRMFLIRREQDRLAELAPVLRWVLAHAAGDALWTPGLALMLLAAGDRAQAAEVLAPVRAARFELPRDAMRSTVLALLTDAMVALEDTGACALLRGQLTHLEGTSIVASSGLVCLGASERYLGMISLVLGELDRAGALLEVALAADEAGGSVLWTNESRLWLAKVRRSQGERDAAIALAERVLVEASAAGLPRLARLAREQLTS